MSPMRDCRQLVPDQVSETIAVSPLPRYVDRSDIACVNFVAMKRYNEEVRFRPCLTPVAYRDTVICYINSSKKRFKSQTLYEPRVKPRTFSDTLIVFPKRPVKSFVTCLDYHIDECRRWFKTTMDFKARTFTTKKIIREDENANELNDSDLEGSEVNDRPPSPGASQIFLPRWNKDRPVEDNNTPPLVNGEIVFNGF